MNNNAKIIGKNKKTLNLNILIDFKEYLYRLGDFSGLNNCVIHGVNYTGRNQIIDIDRLLTLDHLKNHAKVLDLIVIDYLNCSHETAQLYIDLRNLTCFLQIQNK